MEEKIQKQKAIFSEAANRGHTHTLTFPWTKDGAARHKLAAMYAREGEMGAPLDAVRLFDGRGVQKEGAQEFF
jgi:hypothetical protein